MTGTPTLSIERDAWLAQALGRDAFRVSMPPGAAAPREAFQAPGFYQRLGFTECGRIRDDPPGHDRIFYVKRFADGGAGPAPPP